MKAYKNIIIIGTSHISKESMNEVEKIILEKKPDVVTLELDKERFVALLNKDQQERKLRFRDIKKIGVKGYFFALMVEWVEKSLGSKVGVNPGEDMMKAAEVAKSQGIKVALIDQKINITLQRLSSSITWKEKWRFFTDLIKAAFGIGEKIKFDLNKVPSDELIEKMLLQVKDRYPSVYNTLVVERNVYMAKKIKNLMENFPLIVVIVGAGHVDGLLEEIKE